jgi:hypothetical protein
MMSYQREEVLRVVTDKLEINTTCLDMVLPFCMKQMIQQRPLPRYENDAEDIESIIWDLCERHKVAEPEVEKFIALASGYDDVLILLERPSMDHDYDDDLETFIERSPVLQGVGELIKTATRGSRSILDTVVLDVFSFKPKGRSYPTDEECYEITEQMIRKNTPQVVLGCCAGIDPKHWLYQFNAVSPNTKPTVRSADIQGTTVQFIPSFHPGFCLNHVPWSAQLRLLLVYHFLLTFRCTILRPSIPGWSLKTLFEPQV